MGWTQQKLSTGPEKAAGQEKTEEIEGFRTQGDFVKWLRLQVKKPRDASDSACRASGGQDL